MSAHKHSSPTVSCEFFPPNTDAGLEKLLNTKQVLEEALHPEFFSVTFGAGGSTRDKTLEAIKHLSKQSCDNIAPHISCMGSTRQQIADLLDTYIALGIKRLVTLRGDIPENNASINELHHACELVEFIREKTGDHFHIEVAAYPEYHPESTSPAEDFKYFKQKITSGADSAITQYFYNIDAYHYLIEKCDRENITVPIVPGIMPITNYSNLTRFSDNCGAEIPRWIRKQLEFYQDDLDSLKAFGNDVVSNLCNNLLEAGAPGLHFYTLNQVDATVNIWNQLKR